jgi:hypothetical protein
MELCEWGKRAATGKHSKTNSPENGVIQIITDGFHHQTTENKKTKRTLLHGK